MKYFMSKIWRVHFMGDIENIDSDDLLMFVV